MKHAGFIILACAMISEHFEPMNDEHLFLNELQTQ